MKNHVFQRGRCAAQRNLVLRRRLLSVLVAGCFAPAAVLANPGGQQVVSGQASFSQQGGILTVTNSPGAIINWQNFSINAGETTRFVQQSTDSSVLNRVVGQDPSQILGTLQSNGRVFLINPNGILFGQGARVDVSGLVASTLNISNDDFLAGRLKFEGTDAGNLKNQGAISTPNGGQVYLIAPNVENSGIITAPNGDVLLAAGHSVHLVDSANPALQVVLSAPENQALNIGQILAQGGKVSVYGALINQRGLVSADSAVVGDNGKIYFRASREINLDAASKTSANGASGGSVRLHSDGITLVKGAVEARGEQAKGGTVELLGAKVGVMDQALVDASGKAGGGTVLIGGDYQGKGSVPNAQVTYTGQQATIRADATGDGDGGRVIVWADDTTRSYAHISVRGGEDGGNGGFVETSGKRHLDVGSAFPDVTAPKGEAGTWLLDPDEITIDASTSDVGITLNSPFSPNPVGPSTLSVATLTNYLQTNGHVMVATGPNSGNGNITVNAPINVSLASHGSLELWAHGDINLNAPIVASGNGLDVSLLADTDQSGAGSVIVGSLIDSNGGAISLRGAHVYLTPTGVLEARSGHALIHADLVEGSIQMDAGSAINASDGVHLRADNMNLDGSIDAFGVSEYGGVFISTHSNNRQIKLGTKVTGTLGLNATELQSIKGYRLMIGDPMNTGGITVSNPVSLSGDNITEFWLSTSGPITVASSLGMTSTSGDKRLDLHSNGNAINLQSGANISGWHSIVFHSAGGSINMATGASIDGAATADHSGWLMLNSGTGAINLAAGASVRSPNWINLTGDQMTLNGVVESTALPDPFGDGWHGGISITPYTTTRAINLGTKVTGSLGFSGGELQNLRGNGLSIGSMMHTGGITVSAPIALSGTDLRGLHLSNAGNITVNSALTTTVSTGHSGVRLESMGAISIAPGGSIDVSSSGEVGFSADQINFNGTVRAGMANIRPYTSNRAITVGSTTCQVAPCLTVTNLGQLNVSTIGIGQYDDYSTDLDSSYSLSGPIHVAGITYATGNSLTDRHANTTRIGLMGGGNITQSGSINVQDLALVTNGGVSVTHSGNTVQFLSGWADGPFSFTNSHGFAVTEMVGAEPDDYGIFGVESYGGDIALTALTGDIQIGSDIWAEVGNISLKAGGALTTLNEAIVEGGHLSASAGAGIHLQTNINSLAATNSGGSSAIHVENDGPLALMNVSQAAAGTGSIYVSSFGGLRVESGYMVSTDAGSITMLANSPLNVNGTVQSNTGNIDLEAGSNNTADDNLSVAGLVSTQGHVVLKAGATAFDNNNVTAATLTKIENGNTTATTTVIHAPVAGATPVQEPAVTGSVATTQSTLIATIESTTISTSTTTTTTSTSTDETSQTSDVTADSTTSETSESEPQEESSESTAQNDTGASKNEPVKKMYCN